MSQEDTEIIEYSVAMKLEYPYKRLFMTDNYLTYCFNNLKSYKLNFLKKNFVLANIDLSKIKKTTKNRTVLNGLILDNAIGNTLIVTSSTDYSEMNIISDYFIEHQRVKCTRYDNDQSPYDTWQKFKTSIIFDVNEVTISNLNNGIYKINRGCGNFRSSLLSGFIKLFNSKSVLDISAGWGDRLLACMANEVRYVGTDPNPNLHPEYKKMIERFAVDPSKYTLIESPFETADLPKETFDLVFSSPPFFNLEIYETDNKEQSIAKYNTMELWLTEFLFKSLDKAWSYLNSGGYMVINMNNTSNDDYTTPMINYINTKHKDAIFVGCLGHTEKIQYKNPRAQPLWIWQKF